MKPSIHHKAIIVEIVSYLFILLFVYAAISKLMDFHNFRIQVAQSPLLTAFAGNIAVAVVSSELVISILLAIKGTRLIALYSALALMVMFSIYIYLVLNYSPYIPCSCGGILEEMGWTEHLYFNIIFCILAALAIYFIEIPKKSGQYLFLTRTGVIIVFSTALMVTLFLTSENIVYKNNNFVRRFPPFPAKRAVVKDLKFASYYFAGADETQIYLGNHTAPGLVTVIDTALQNMSSFPLNVRDTLFEFRNVKLKVVPPNFFLFDGTVPCIFKGDLITRDARLLQGKIPGFTKAVIIDSVAVVARTLNPHREHRLTKINLKNLSSVTISDSLLKKQKDGFFDTDGELHFDNYTKRMVYIYYYRNQYIIADDNLNLIAHGNTIDTTTTANIKTEYVGTKKIKKFSAPPLMVNRASTLYRNLLFINSTLPGKFETEKMWTDANVIDVYDTSTQNYVMSFYVYKVDGGRPDYLLATNNHLFVLFGNKMVSYRFSEEFKKKFVQ